MAEKAARNEVAVRSTEGPKPTENASRAGRRGQRGPGRPKGSQNRPKGLVPKDLANEILLQMKEQLPAEHFDYMKGVIAEGKAISTKQELDTLILLLSRNLYGALIDEMRPPAEPENLEDALELVKDTGSTKPKQQFRRDVTERLKVLNSFLTLRNNIEKAEKPEDSGESPVVKLWAARGMQGRLAILVQGMTPDGPEPVPADRSRDGGDVVGPGHLLGDPD